MVDKVRLAVLSGGHLVDDMYQGAVPALVALLVIERHYSYAAATIRLGHLLAVPGLLGLVAAPSTAWALAAMAVLGVATYLPFSVQTTLGQDYLPGRVGTASGVTLGLAVSAGGLFTPRSGCSPTTPACAPSC